MFHVLSALGEWALAITTNIYIITLTKDIRLSDERRPLLHTDNNAERGVVVQGLRQGQSENLVEPSAGHRGLSQPRRKLPKGPNAKKEQHRFARVASVSGKSSKSDTTSICSAAPSLKAEASLVSVVLVKDATISTQKPDDLLPKPTDQTISASTATNRTTKQPDILAKAEQRESKKKDKKMMSKSRNKPPAFVRASTSSTSLSSDNQDKTK